MRERCRSPQGPSGREPAHQEVTFAATARDPTSRSSSWGLARTRACAAAAPPRPSRSRPAARRSSRVPPRVRWHSARASAGAGSSRPPRAPRRAPGADLQQLEAENIGESLAQQLALDLDHRATERRFEPGRGFDIFPMGRKDSCSIARQRLKTCDIVWNFPGRPALIPPPRTHARPPRGMHAPSEPGAGVLGQLYLVDTHARGSGRRSRG